MRGRRIMQCVFAVLLLPASLAGCAWLQRSDDVQPAPPAALTGQTSYSAEANILFGADGAPLPPQALQPESPATGEAAHTWQARIIYNNGRTQVRGVRKTGNTVEQYDSTTSDQGINARKRTRSVSTTGATWDRAPR